MLNFHAFILKLLDVQPTEILQECCPVLRSRVRCIPGVRKPTWWKLYEADILLHPYPALPQLWEPFWTVPDMDVKVKFALIY